ncbi:2-oxo-4-hydroxy-4-carboxy-5-ureidoimidazoline decarboxylase [Synchytrium endobioticum]|uniref:2-oxo-4-hydroxy-4-carboxy-5-ureidoimidazoline decarboxylase n=1 Tax=Synchytrium endobioticum TaxID=286115 RepID=A0A507D4T1_9FUNG|nr:2-oxo-4-hydroxy-4-carboxy-5-ureidoimidazoline decarboxylase [Synchytrium endobioticum]TPX48005.1 2-oxo-4-hydroxy-4-carboxy-5-ureidoimidazoline decarboxylase [Synchytrium endobioticum]
MSTGKPATIPRITKLNTLARDAFLEIINILFETAPPLANALYAARPYASYEALIDQAEASIGGLSRDERIQVINAHPRIGASKATLSALSYAEQGYASQPPSAPLGKPLSEDEAVNTILAELNKTYENQFGFKFVVFVAGRPRKQIIPVMEGRLNNQADQELETGLSEMMAIARDRLTKLPQE